MTEELHAAVERLRSYIKIYRGARQSANDAEIIISHLDALAKQVEGLEKERDEAKQKLTDAIIDLHTQIDTLEYDVECANKGRDEATAQVAVCVAALTFAQAVICDCSTILRGWSDDKFFTEWDAKVLGSTGEALTKIATALFVERPMTTDTQDVVIRSNCGHMSDWWCLECAADLQRKLAAANTSIAIMKSGLADAAAYRELINDVEFRDSICPWCGVDENGYPHTLDCKWMKAIQRTAGRELLADRDRLTAENDRLAAENAKLRQLDEYDIFFNELQTMNGDIHDLTAENARLRPLIDLMADITFPLTVEKQDAIELCIRDSEKQWVSLGAIVSAFNAAALNGGANG